MLREPRPEEIDALVRMMNAFNAIEGIVLEEPALRSALATLLGDPSLGRVWLFDEGGGVLGYAVLTFGFDLEFGGRDAFITELFVAADARGRGLAGRALAEVERRAAELGVRAVHLMVRPENAPAVRLYARAGYASPPRRFLSKLLPRGGGG